MMRYSEWPALRNEEKSQHLPLVSQLPSLLPPPPPFAGPARRCWCSREALPWCQAGKREARLWGRSASGTESGYTGAQQQHQKGRIPAAHGSGSHS
ncbi:hypothetical protein Nmel_009184 [Mimus melanotis]